MALLLSLLIPAAVRVPLACCISSISFHALLTGSYPLSCIPPFSVASTPRLRPYPSLSTRFALCVYCAASYVVDWKENRSLTSQDRTPGLGTTEEKPHDWEQRFCDVPDRRMQTLVMRLFSPSTGRKRTIQWRGLSWASLARTV